MHTEEVQWLMQKDAEKMGTMMSNGKYPKASLCAKCVTRKGVGNATKEKVETHFHERLPGKKQRHHQIPCAAYVHEVRNDWESRLV